MSQSITYTFPNKHVKIGLYVQHLKEDIKLKQLAKEFATQAHQGQLRKNAQIPYITHPIRVAKRLEAARLSDELICAGYLHDVVEDTPYEMKDIEERFGSRVAYLVAAHTEDKTKSWQERKQHTIDTLKTAEKEVKYLIVADRLDNLLDLEQALEKQGPSVWHNFNAGPDRQKWYNEEIAKSMVTGLDQTDIPDFFHEFTVTIDRVFRE